MTKKSSRRQQGPPRRSSPTVEQLAEIDSHGVAFQQQYGVQIQVNPPGQPLERQPPPKTPLPRVRDLNDPIRLGVHPAVDLNGNRIPEYIARDADRAIDQFLNEGSFLLIVGDSTSGKSRTAYEIMRARFPDYSVFIPATAEELLNVWTYLPEIDKCIIWLDDFEIFLGTKGLNIQILNRIRSDNSILLATIRAEEYNNLSPLAASRIDSDETHRRAVSRILEQAQIVHLERRWSEDELNRARSSSDRRVVEATGHAELYGIAEYLATGPQLFSGWLAAWAPGTHPRGAALVAVAVDFRRAGFHLPVSIDVLKDLHTQYLSNRGGEILRPEPFHDALQWACTPLHATSSLLLPSGEDRYFAFDYLVDTVQRQRDAAQIPDTIWERIFEIAPNAALSQIGIAAEWVQRADIAKRAFETLARLGDGHSAFHVGLYYRNRGEHEKAEIWFRDAADAGEAIGALYLGKTLFEKEQYDEAEAALKRAIEMSDSEYSRAAASGELGRVQASRSKWSEAEEMLRFAVQTPRALDEIKPREIAFRMPADYEEAVRRSDKTTALNQQWIFAHVLQELKKIEEAKVWYLKAAEGGNSRAANDLGALLEGERLQKEAAEWYGRSAAAGDIRGEINLGRMLAESGQYEKAKLWFRRAADAGSSDAAVMLGHVYADQHNRKNARFWFRRADDADNPLGTFGLGSIFEKENQLDKAAPLFQRASDLGYKHALIHLGIIEEKKDNSDDAERLYRDAIKSGDTDGLMRLGDLIWRRKLKLKAAGELTPEVDQQLSQEIELQYVRAQKKGHSQAAQRLQSLREEERRPEPKRIVHQRHRARKRH